MIKSIIIITGVVLIVWLYHLFTRPLPAFRALPHSVAERAQEYYVSSDFLPNYTHCIKAPLNVQQFQEFVTKMEFSKGSALKTYPQTCNNKWHNNSWWDPPLLKEAVIIFENYSTTTESGELAVFSEGRLYYVGWNS